MTTLVSEDNFEYAFPSALRERYWRELETIVSYVLEQPHDVAVEYRERVESRPVAEQLLAFHESPLAAALDLVGCERLSPEQQARLDEVEGSVHSRAEAPLPPPRWAVALIFYTVPREYRREAVRSLVEEYYQRHALDGVRSARMFVRSQAVHSIGSALSLTPAIAGVLMALIKLVK